MSKILVFGHFLGNLHPFFSLMKEQTLNNLDRGEVKPRELQEKKYKKMSTFLISETHF